MTNHRLKALGYLCVGFIASGISCSLYVYCNLGSDAYNVLTQGVSGTLGMSVGNAFYLTQGAMLLFIAATRRRYIGVGTLLGIFLIGSVMNLWSLLLAPLLQTAGFWVRLCCLATAPAFTGLGISLVKRSGLGLVPSDILPVIFHEWLSRLQFRTVRIIYDGIVFTLGLVLGGTAGIGTVLSVLLTGPCIQLASSLLDAQAKKKVPPDKALTVHKTV